MRAGNFGSSGAGFWCVGESGRKREREREIGGDHRGESRGRLWLLLGLAFWGDCCVVGSRLERWRWRWRAPSLICRLCPACMETGQFAWAEGVWAEDPKNATLWWGCGEGPALRRPSRRRRHKCFAAAAAAAAFVFS